MEKHFYSPQEVADLFGVHRLTVIRWIDMKKIPATQINWKWFIPITWIQEQLSTEVK